MKCRGYGSFLGGRVLGSEHRLPLVSMNDLADSLSDHGRYGEAIGYIGRHANKEGCV
jgi:hypothetical protein